VKPREACRACSECLLVVAVGLLLVTTALHATLGTDRCLAPRLKERLGRYDNGSYVDWRLPRDAVVKIRLVNELPDDDDLFVGENGVAPQRHDDDDGIPGDFRRLGECPLLKPAPSSECDGVLNCDARMAPDTVCGGDDKCGTVANGCYKVQHAHHTPAPSPFRWRVPSGDYTLARDLHLLALNDAFLAEHRVRAYNVSVSMRCLDAASALASVFHRYVLGYDTPLANQAMETLGSSGALRNDNTNIITRWRRSDARRRRLSQRLGAEAAFKWLLRRAGVAVTSLLALFLLSTVTAAVLRVLVASGVCGAFALWYLLSSTRFAQRLDFQALARAYPWLGAVWQATRRLHAVDATRDAVDATRGHLTRSWVVSFLLKRPFGPRRGRVPRATGESLRTVVSGGVRRRGAVGGLRTSRRRRWCVLGRLEPPRLRRPPSRRRPPPATPSTERLLDGVARVGSLPLDGASTFAFSPRMDFVKNCRVHPTHWSIAVSRRGPNGPKLENETTHDLV